MSSAALPTPAPAQFAHLLPPATLTRLVADWLAEDCPALDVGGFVVGGALGEARLLVKSNAGNGAGAVLAGQPFVDEVFAQVGCSVEWHVPEGTTLPPTASSAHPIPIAVVRGPTNRLLLGERVALNTLSRASGVATAAARLSRALRAVGWRGALAGTRKTTPGFRIVEKYAVVVGGGDPHRYDLSAMVMLKDNHVWACYNASKAAERAAKGEGEGAAVEQEQTHTTDQAAAIAAAIPLAVTTARRAAGFSTKIEVEARSIPEAHAAISAGADVVMLDNFPSPAAAAEAATELKRYWRGCGKGDGAFLVEVSGGVDEENARAYAGSDVDVISTSRVHQGVKLVDFSLKVVV